MTPHLNDHAHSTAARLLHAPYAVVGRWSLAQADRVICVSEVERQRIATRFRLPSDRLAVISNGVDINRLLSAYPQEPREKDLILVVSRLEQYKRIDLAIEALAVLPRHYRLVIVGRGSLGRRLAELARSRGVAGRTVFLDTVRDDDLIRWYRRASVLLNLSTAEAFGLTVLECIAAGCRVVCSDIPAFRELATSFPDHLMVTSTSDPVAVSSAVSSFSERPVTYLPDLASFTWSAVVDQLVTVYQEILGPDVVQPLSAPHGPMSQKKGLVS